MNQPVLCYIDHSWAYFTTQELEDQWGDAWGKYPYEHNAGTPYEYDTNDVMTGKEPWRIVKLAWDGDLQTPACQSYNSPWSVKRINARAVAWLSTPSYAPDPPIVIHAGATIAEFTDLVQKAGGDVYEKLPNSYSP